MKLLSPSQWSDYELIDTGDYEKLERFGQYVLRRPEPQAVWRKALSEKEWEKRTDAWFRKEKAGNNKGSDERGKWILKPKMPQQWYISYRYKEMKLRFRLGLTAFKHVGVFPEQASNWDFIYDVLCHWLSPNVVSREGGNPHSQPCHSREGGNPPLESPSWDPRLRGDDSLMRLRGDDNPPKVLNLFAYTGGASLAAKAAGADVTHVDSVKQVLTWSRENMEASGLDGIRWVCEDALKFIRREAKRGNRYNGIILDPPAYGRGPEGEKWILEDSIAELMENCSQIADTERFFCVLNLYSMGFSSLIADNLIRDYFPASTNREYGELFLADQSGKRLPLSVFGRCESI